MNTIFEVGEYAGTLWRTIGKHGALTTTEIVSNTGLSNEEVFTAIGWLARENKIVVGKQGNNLKYDLTNSEKSTFNTTNFNTNNSNTNMTSNRNISTTSNRNINRNK